MLPHFVFRFPENFQPLRCVFFLPFFATKNSHIPATNVCWKRCWDADRASLHVPIFNFERHWWLLYTV